MLLDGRPFEELHEFCDFSLTDQYEAAAAKGVQPNTPTDFTPVVKKSVVYIVGAVIFNEKGEVRRSCVFLGAELLYASHFPSAPHE